MTDSDATPAFERNGVLLRCAGGGRGVQASWIATGTGGDDLASKVAAECEGTLPRERAGGVRPAGGGDGAAAVHQRFSADAVAGEALECDPDETQLLPNQRFSADAVAGEALECDPDETQLLPNQRFSADAVAGQSLEREPDGTQILPKERFSADAVAGEQASTGAAPDLVFQFSMRHLLTATAAAGVFMAVLTRLGVLSGIAAVWLAILVAGHVLATAWGTTAKRRASQRTRMPEERGPAFTPGHVRYAPATRLRESTRLSRVVPIVCGVGALMGSLVGTVLLVRANWERLTLSSMLVGAASCAVIGGFVAFLASSFVTVATSAARQARTEQPCIPAPEHTKNAQG